MASRPVGKARVPVHRDLTLSQRAGSHLKWVAREILPLYKVAFDPCYQVQPHIAETKKNVYRHSTSRLFVVWNWNAKQSTQALSYVKTIQLTRQGHHSGMVYIPLLLVGTLSRFLGRNDVPVPAVQTCTYCKFCLLSLYTLITVYVCNVLDSGNDVMCIAILEEYRCEFSCWNTELLDRQVVTAKCIFRCTYHHTHVTRLTIHGTIDLLLHGLGETVREDQMLILHSVSFLSPQFEISQETHVWILSIQCCC